MRRTILTIAGSDSSGGAGIQADLKTIAALGAYGASVITAITAQNTRGVRSAEVVSTRLVVEQLRAVFEDLDVAAAKTGMLATQEIVEAVADELERFHPDFLVCDPVMISKTGFALLSDDCIDALRDRLFPLATLVTPNVHEAERLTGRTVRTIAEAEIAGRELLGFGPRAVLVKGGHLSESPATDVLVTPDGARTFPGTWVDTGHTHGTGCTLSAALATALGSGLALEDAIVKAKTFLTEAIRAGEPVGHGISPPNPFFGRRPK